MTKPYLIWDSRRPDPVDDIPLDRFVEPTPPWAWIVGGLSGLALMLALAGMIVAWVANPVMWP